ncbi:phage tail assembly chaperone family protein, TAC [Acinetobacter sp. AYS6]|uniref:phage tail assembly chaperone family protein, TAC n=1 Tax=Acinetobacter sp. AYS6 TaxID=2983297 RepID=UPI0021D676EB|nr:phage tail assembly chaperone family protein, TAC [Acinetobacter sp. AYS6]MCU7696195.1 phage tail assembly chaperone family protein, TAC [Acinetobacter sp. AYS6]
MKKLSADQIKSGILLGKPEQVTVQVLVNGEKSEFTTYIKPFNYQSAVANMKAYGENKEALAGILASCITDEHGVPTFTEDEVRLHFSQALVDIIWVKIVEINVMGKQTLKSTTEKSSSSKSRSQPQDQSKKSEQALPTKKLELGQLTDKKEVAST